MHCFYTSAFSTSWFSLAAMDGKIEQHVCIKFCVKLGKSTTKTPEMLCEAFEWHSCFKAGRVSVEDDECSEQPKTSIMAENVEGKHSRTHPRRPLPKNP
jgi:hypothetical protein